MDWNDLAKEYTREVLELTVDDHQRFPLLMKKVADMPCKVCLYITRTQEGGKALGFFSEEDLNTIARKDNRDHHPYREEMAAVEAGKTFLMVKPDGSRHIMNIPEFCKATRTHLQTIEDSKKG